MPIVVSTKSKKLSSKPSSSECPAPMSRQAGEEIAKRLSGARKPGDAALTSGCGVIAYTWNLQNGTILGQFVLAMYEGNIATETGVKVAGAPGQLAGTYAIQTYTSTGALFAQGLLILEPVGTNGAYAVKYILDPVDPAGLGYVPGTLLFYDAIGYQTQNPPSLSVAWDNDLYTRNIGTGLKEWGYRLVSPT